MVKDFFFFFKAHARAREAPGVVVKNCRLLIAFYSVTENLQCLRLPWPQSSSSSLFFSLSPPRPLFFFFPSSFLGLVDLQSFVLELSGSRVVASFVVQLTPRCGQREVTACFCCFITLPIHEKLIPLKRFVSDARFRIIIRYEFDETNRPISINTHSHSKERS